MSSDAAFLDQLARALNAVRLDALVIGNTACVLHGAPVLTQDVDLLVRDTPANRKKITALARQFSARVTELSDLTHGQRLVGSEIPIDVLFDRIAGGFAFNALKKRSIEVAMGSSHLRVAALEDVIASKRAAGRRKDLAALPILEDTLAVIRATRAKKR